MAGQTGRDRDPDLLLPPHRKNSHDEGDAEDSRSDDGQAFFPLLKAYTIFHFSQIEGTPDYVPPYQDENGWQTPEAMQTILDVSGIEVRTVNDGAYYIPSKDILCLPPRQAFGSANSMAEVKAHKCGRATAHPSRLNRQVSTKFGSHEYAFEELVVSISTCLVGSPPSPSSPWRPARFTPFTS